MALTVTPAELTATALTLTTAAQPNITSVGTLSALTVSGNLNATLTNAAQTNITSLGTLTGLTVSGNLTVDTSTLVVDATNNRVGAGVASPQSNMHVLGTLKVATGNAQGILGLGEGAGTTVNVGLWRGAANNPTSDGNFLNLGGYDGIVFAASAAAIGSQTERMRLTAAGINVTGDVTANTGSSTTSIRIKNSVTGSGSTDGALLQVDSNEFYIWNYENDDVIFGANNDEKMRIDGPTGNVGVNTSAVRATMHIKAADNNWESGLLIENNSGNKGWNFHPETNGELLIGYNAATNASLTNQTASVVMKLDTSGRVMVGKTSTSLADVGHDFHPSGFSFHTRDGGEVAYFNRKTSDGGIVNFYKDGSTVGSLATQGGEICLMAPSGGGIRVRSSMISVIPVNASRTNLDATTDLGSSSARFKNIYLSGGAYLGGTGAANKLDDYEEGTWTPNVQRQNGSVAATFSTHSGSATYTKIGNTVNVNAFINNISAGSSNGNNYWVIYGIPFAGQVIDYTAGILGYNSSAANGLYVGDASGNAILTLNAAPYSGSLSGEFMLNITFRVT